MIIWFQLLQPLFAEILLFFSIGEFYPFIAHIGMKLKLLNGLYPNYYTNNEDSWVFALNFRFK